MITSPLDLKKHLRQPAKRFDFVPLLDVFFIALFFVMLSPRFVLSPGLSINLPESPGETPMAGLPASAVVTVRSDEMILFEGQILTPENLGRAMSQYLGSKSDSAVLIYFDRRVSVQTLLFVSEAAREAGVTRIQLAAEPEGDEGEPLFR